MPRTETITLYNFDELSDEAKEKARDYVRNNWHDLAQHYVDDMIETLKALKTEIGGDLDYSISVVPDRGEFVKLSGYSPEKLAKLMLKKDECPLTGMCYDIDVTEALAKDELEHAVLKTLHAEGEYTYSDEGIDEMLTANEHEFTEEGKFYK